MSSQANQGRRGRNRGGRGNFTNNRRSQRSNHGRGGNAPKNKDDDSNSLLTKLQREYNPPFVLGAKWSAKDHYKVKVPHPFLQGEKETVNFPVFESGNSLSDRALFYGEVLDLQENVGFDGANGGLLYYTFRRCLKGDALNEWKDITSGRTQADLTPANFSTDIDAFIKKHDSRENEDLLQDQLNYFNKLKKPANKSPSNFKTDIESLNKKIEIIPGATEIDSHDEERLKAIYYDAMPKGWRSQFRKVGKKLRDESLEEMAQYFDILYSEENHQKPNKAKTDQHNNQNQTRNSSTNQQSRNGRPDPEDICPVHGNHKWKECYLNPYGNNYRPRTATSNNNGNRNQRNSGDAHMNSQSNTSAQNDQNNSRDTANPQGNESTNDANPYGDEYYGDNNNTEEKVPQVRAKVKVGNINHTFNKALLDSGGSRSLIARSRIPVQIKPSLSKNPFPAVGTSGTRTHKESIIFDRLSFPDFEMPSWLSEVECFVFDDDGHSSYDLILGRDILKPIGMEMNFASEEINWQNVTRPFTQRGKIPTIPQPEAIRKAEDSFFSKKSELQMKSSDYDTRTSGNEIAQQQLHLSEDQRKEMATVLNEFNDMFNQTLGVYPHKKANLTLIDPNVTPIHVRPFTVPNKLRKLFKEELDKLVRLEVLEPILTSAWAFPTFLVPKKDNTARFVSDFRKLNQLIVDESCPLPIIKDVLTRRLGFDWVTAIDLTSQFFHFLLTKFASLLCTITTPFGLYRYRRLPMGIKTAPSFAQAVMQSLFGPNVTVEWFLDDVAIFTKGTYSEHLEEVKKILKILANSGFSIKPKKCAWAQKSIEYLGHIITTDGVKPQPKKVDAVLRLQPPATPKQLRSFIGMVNYYRDHVRQRAHILAPLTAQTKNKKQITWTNECQASFDEIKSKLAQDALLAYPNPNFPFVIEPDASDYQLGSVILQNTVQRFSRNDIARLFLSTTQNKAPTDFRPIAYFSRKLTSAQMNYTVLEKELLSIVETLLEFRTFLWGCQIFVFSDHRNLTFDNLRSQRALRWRLIAEDFNITIIHRPGVANVGADALSRLPLLNPEEPVSVRQAEERFKDAYLFYPVQNYMNEIYPLSFKAIETAQNNDQELQATVVSKPKIYQKKEIGSFKMIYRKAPSNFRANTGPSEIWKIVIPTSLVNASLSWFHRILRHPGATRMFYTISRNFYFPKMKETITEFVKTCDICQRIKVSFPGLGEVPPKLAENNPWEEVQTDLIGPWEFKFSSKVSFKISAVTTVDPFLGLCEIRRIKNKTSAHVATRFYEMWLSRYPRPLRCIHDNGSEFTSQEFQDTLTFFGIQSVPTTVKNPQANAIVERMHQTTATILRSMVTEAQLANRTLLLSDSDDFIDTALASTQHAINASMHMTTRETPGALTFNRDMILPLQTIADWECIRHRKQAMIHRNNLLENSKRRSFDWQPGIDILLEDKSGPKLRPKYSGPFRIEKIHTNGTVTIKIKNRVFQRVNIRRIKPYYSRD